MFHVSYILFFIFPIHFFIFSTYFFVFKHGKKKQFGIFSSPGAYIGERVRSFSKFKSLCKGERSEFFKVLRPIHNYNGRFLNILIVIQPTAKLLQTVATPTKIEKILNLHSNISSILSFANTS